MKQMIYLVAGVILGGFIVVFIMTNKMADEFFFESKSNFGFEETVAKFEAKVDEAPNWKIQHVYDLQKSMAVHNYKVLQVKVFSLCNPEHAAKILFSNQERVVSSMMPCRVSIYVKQDGQTYIARMNSGEMAQMMGGLVEEVMVDATDDVEEILKTFIE